MTDMPNPFILLLELLYVASPVLLVLAAILFCMFGLPKIRRQRQIKKDSRLQTIQELERAEEYFRLRVQAQPDNAESAAQLQQCRSLLAGLRSEMVAEGQDPDQLLRRVAATAEAREELQSATRGS